MADLTVIQSMLTEPAILGRGVGAVGVWGWGCDSGELLDAQILKTKVWRKGGCGYSREGNSHLGKLWPQRQKC